MAEFLGMVITNLGLQLQTKAQAGTTLSFTRVAIGDGYATRDQLKSLSELVHETRSLPITEIRKIADGQVQVKAVLSNRELTTGTYVREIGLFANDPDLGEILYCVANAGSTADFLPAGGGNDVVEEILNIVTVIGEAANVTANIPEGAFVTIDQLQAHVGDTNLHIPRSEFESELAHLRNRITLLEATFADSFTNNRFTEDLSTLDAIVLTRGYYNEALTRLEV